MQTVGREEVRYAELRDGEHWREGVVFDGLVVKPDGYAELLQLPALTPASVAEPSQVAASGLALDENCGLYLADTSSNRLLRLGLDCGQQLALGGKVREPRHISQLSSPTGLCVGLFGWLFVADSGSGRVLVYTTPGLELRDAWTSGLVRPVGLAVGEEQAVYVLDAGLRRVLRFDSFGRRDTQFNARFELPSGGHEPVAISATADGILYIACRDLPGIFPYDAEGTPAGQPIGGQLRAQALTVAGGVIYAADVVSGEIQLFSLPDGQFQGSVAGFRGPVAALAADSAGTVYLKAGLDGNYLAARAAAARRAGGRLLAGPLDAGEERYWHRAVVRADVPLGTEVKLETFTSDDCSASPVWTAAEFPDLLVGKDRFLWLQVKLHSLDGLSTPLLGQVDAETSGDSYLPYLPSVYGRDPEASLFLEGILDIARSILGDLESAIATLSRHYRVATTPASELPWLASWQAFEVPSDLADGGHPARLRALVEELPELYARRGTPAGVSRYIEIYTGVRPHLFESFRGRAAWVLGSASALGFDTGLARVGLEDLVVEQDLVGSGPLGPFKGLGRAIFEETAHRFTVVLPAAAAPSAAMRHRVHRVLEEQKPAHTTYHVCFAKPEMRVGVQARLDIDAIVAGSPPAARLGGGGALANSIQLLQEPQTAPGAVERRARVGIETKLG